jgi:hypothetical protein
MDQKQSKKQTTMNVITAKIILRAVATPFHSLRLMGGKTTMKRNSGR